MKAMLAAIPVFVCFAFGPVWSAESDLFPATRQETFVYKKIGERTLDIIVHYPADWSAEDKRPAIVFFFGGGWNKGNPSQFEAQANYLAGRGMVALRADYRLKSKDGVSPDKCVEDARSAMRWIRANAASLGIDHGKIVASGGSAGGHLAACCGMAESADDPNDDLTISARAQALLLFNPVMSFMHMELAGRVNGDTEIARKISPTEHLAADTPPCILFFGSQDRLKALADEYAAKARTLGVRCDEYVQEGVGHGFFNRSPYTEATLHAADEFLASLGYLQGPPTFERPSSEALASARGESRRRSKTSPDQDAAQE